MIIKIYIERTITTYSITRANCKINVVLSQVATKIFYVEISLETCVNIEIVNRKWIFIWRWIHNKFSHCIVKSIIIFLKFLLFYLIKAHQLCVRPSNVVVHCASLASLNIKVEAIVLGVHVVSENKWYFCVWLRYYERLHSVREVIHFSSSTCHVGEHCAFCPCCKSTNRNPKSIIQFSVSEGHVRWRHTRKGKICSKHTNIDC